MNMDWKELCAKALDGHRESLETLIKEVQDKVYYLSLRMLVNPEEAQDASQEILIKVVTKLSQFKGESSFPTWVYRIASNTLLDIIRSSTGPKAMTWEHFQEELHTDLEDPGALSRNPEYALLLSEVRMGCTMAMLLCLVPEQRIAYIFGEIFELESRESSEVLGISAASFRKRLSRAKQKVKWFMDVNCGLINPDARCSCERRVVPGLHKKRINSRGLYYAGQNGPEYALMRERIRNTSRELRAHFSQRDIPVFHSPENFSEQILKAIR